MNLLGKYKNGNYLVHIYSDGTKIRMLPDEYEDFTPSFAENCDVHISNKCDNGCEFCYANCSMSGKHGNILDNKFLDTLHPYTELALNLNFPAHPDLKEFLLKLKEKKVIANITVNQNHFVKNQPYIMDLKSNGLFTGIGISLTDANDELVELMGKYDNAVLHVINGIVTAKELDFLSDKNIKMLILGYKELKRGVDYLSNHNDDIKKNMKYLYDNLDSLLSKFNVVSLDNLSIKQLEVKRLLSDKYWEEFYMGDDGTVTFYIDLVEQTFSKNSLCDVKYPLEDDIDKMFKIILENA